MGPLNTLITCLLLVVGTVKAQTGSRNSSERLLPQWLTGIIAVSCFLLISFIFFVAKKMWCEKSGGRRGSNDSVRDEDHIDGSPYDTRLEDLRKKRSTKANENEYTSSDTYDTKLDAMRKEKSTQSVKENVYDTIDTYDSSISIIRRGNSGETKDGEDVSAYATSLDERTSYDNPAMDSSEDRSTVM